MLLLRPATQQERTRVGMGVVGVQTSRLLICMNIHVPFAIVLCLRPCMWLCSQYHALLPHILQKLHRWLASIAWGRPATIVPVVPHRSDQHLVPLCGDQARPSKKGQTACLGPASHRSSMGLGTATRTGTRAFAPTDPATTARSLGFAEAP